MASNSSTRAKLGTAIALIGGAVGTGIIIYALMGGQLGQQLAGDASDTAPSTEQNIETASVSNGEQTAVPTQNSAPETTAEDNTNPVPNSAPETKNTDAPTDPAIETDDDGTTQTETATTNEPTTSVSETTEQETSETDTTEPETTEIDAPQPQVIIENPTVSSTGEPATPTIGDGPAVSTEDPVMPGADAVVLEATTAPATDAPRLDPNDPAVPKFDLVRIEADGSAVIAGRAPPNAEVQILSNGEEIGTASASARGEFVALIDTELTTTAQSLALVAAAPDGGRVQSQSNVIVLARTATEIDNLDEEISLAPAIVQATPDAVRVIQPVVGLADLDRVSLDTISYDQTGQVVLAGRGRPGFVTRIYADGKALSDSKISSSGTWSAVINSLDAGRYVIRVDELSPQGEVASRVESPFQRIFPSPEQLALLTEASSVIVQPGNNLWTIAEGRYGEGVRYTTIFEANREQIRDADLIYPGQVFELPDSAPE